MSVVRELSISTLEADNCRIVKKPKTSHDANHDNEDMQPVCEHLNTKNSSLKGRRRFLADLYDMADACQPGFVVKGLRSRNLRAGDDEGSIEFKLSHLDQHLATVNLLVSDTSEYPKGHTFYAFTPDAAPTQPVIEVIENISSDGSRTIFDTVCRTMSAIAHKLNPSLYDAIERGPQVSNGQDVDEDPEDDDNEAMDYDDDEAFGLPGVTVSSALKLDRLQGDFVEIIASSTQYRLGFIPFGNDAFSLSISIPVVELASSIPPHALQAWDHHILARAQHLTLLIGGFRGVYPALGAADGAYTYDARVHGTSLTFRVGLTGRYKPGKEHAQEAGRAFSLVVPDDEEGVPMPQQPMDGGKMHAFEEELTEKEEEFDPHKFAKFALSQSLDSLMHSRFLRILQLRLQYKLGWAGAELLLAEQEKLQLPAHDVHANIKQILLAADCEERELIRKYNYRLPSDPLFDSERKDHLNLPLLAFSYLLRRLMLCSKFCMVCHSKIQSEYEALKPYVCSSKLCEYQYYQLNMGPSLEYEICANTGTLDLLISMTYCAAAEGRLNPLPIGLGLRVPLPERVINAPFSYPMMTSQFGPPVAPTVPPMNIPTSDADGLVDFDRLDAMHQMAAVAEQLDTVPSVLDMKAYLVKKLKAGKQRPLVKHMAAEVLSAAWALVRWCLGSCTAHLERLTDPDEMIQNIDSSWQQFRFSVGAPEAEAKFYKALQEAQAQNAKAKEYPFLYAFHGSPFRNWHSIIRNGLWYKDIAHGRAFGNGVYFALQGEVSMGSYASATSTRWKNSNSNPSSGVALAQIINLPSKFTSRQPYLVVPETSWIICRYLLVKCASTSNTEASAGLDVPFVELDPEFKVTVQNKTIKIPQPAYKLTKMLTTLRCDHLDEDYDDDDRNVFEYGTADALGLATRPTEIDDNQDDQGDPDDYDETWAYEDDNATVPTGHSMSLPPPMGSASAAPSTPDWEHDSDWVDACVTHVIPPPAESSNGATLALQRELNAMLKEQKSARSLRDLGWYISPDRVGDNLYQWIVELHSFDENLPIAVDMKAKGVNSLVFDIRFPVAFPHSPPFFRILKPRFLPFFQGGGGHVTGGGSICMDLLTSDNWLPSYSISAILLQIRLAISNPDPHPARLAPNWDQPYGVGEALEGYKRAATAHNWTIPAGLDKLVR